MTTSAAETKTTKQNKPSWVDSHMAIVADSSMRLTITMAVEYCAEQVLRWYDANKFLIFDESRIHRINVLACAICKRPHLLTDDKFMQGYAIDDNVRMQVYLTKSALISDRTTFRLTVLNFAIVTDDNDNKVLVTVCDLFSKFMSGGKRTADRASVIMNNHLDVKRPFKWYHSFNSENECMTIDITKPELFSGIYGHDGKYDTTAERMNSSKISQVCRWQSFYYLKNYMYNNSLLLCRQISDICEYLLDHNWSKKASKIDKRLKHEIELQRLERANMAQLEQERQVCEAAKMKREEQDLASVLQLSKMDLYGSIPLHYWQDVMIDENTIQDEYIEFALPETQTPVTSKKIAVPDDVFDFQQQNNQLAQFVIAAEQCNQSLDDHHRDSIEGRLCTVFYDYGKNHCEITENTPVRLAAYILKQRPSIVLRCSDFHKMNISQYLSETMIQALNFPIRDEVSDTVSFIDSTGTKKMMSVMDFLDQVLSDKVIITRKTQLYHVPIHALHARSGETHSCNEYEEISLPVLLQESQYHLRNILTYCRGSSVFDPSYDFEIVFKRVMVTKYFLDLELDLNILLEIDYLFVNVFALTNKLEGMTCMRSEYREVLKRLI